MSDSRDEIRVKVLSKSSLANRCGGWEALFPGRKPVWGRCRFISDPFESAYDWLVVIHDLPRLRPTGSMDPRALDTLTCPLSHTLFVTTEPATITRYGNHFVRQFAHLLTSQGESELPHPHAIRSHTGNIWFYGKTFDAANEMPPCAKPKLLSTVCSSKKQKHTLHAKRLEFTNRLARAIPEMDIFGHGVRPIECKADALDPYAFHLAVENHFAPNHWTEKLADAFLGYAVPIYYGCPNIFDYFPQESLIPIDIDDFEGALRTIKQALTIENYQRRLPAVQEARRRVLNHYGLPALLARIIVDLEEAGTSREVRPQRLYNRHQMRIRAPQDFLDFACWQIKNFISSV